MMPRLKPHSDHRGSVDSPAQDTYKFDTLDNRAESFSELFERNISAEKLVQIFLSSKAIIFSANGIDMPLAAQVAEDENSDSFKCYLLLLDRIALVQIEGNARAGILSEMPGWFLNPGQDGHTVAHKIAMRRSSSDILEFISFLEQLLFKNPQHLDKIREIFSVQNNNHLNFIDLLVANTHLTPEDKFKILKTLLKSELLDVSQRAYVLKVLATSSQFGPDICSAMVRSDSFRSFILSNELHVRDASTLLLKKCAEDDSATSGNQEAALIKLIMEIKMSGERKANFLRKMIIAKNITDPTLILQVLGDNDFDLSDQLNVLFATPKHKYQTFSDVDHGQGWSLPTNRDHLGLTAASDPGSQAFSVYITLLSGMTSKMTGEKQKLYMLRWFNLYGLGKEDKTMMHYVANRASGKEIVSFLNVIERFYVPKSSMHYEALQALFSNRGLLKCGSFCDLVLRNQALRDDQKGRVLYQLITKGLLTPEAIKALAKQSDVDTRELVYKHMMSGDFHQQKQAFFLANDESHPLYAFFAYRSFSPRFLRHQTYKPLVQKQAAELAENTDVALEPRVTSNFVA